MIEPWVGGSLVQKRSSQEGAAGDAVLHFRPRTGRGLGINGDLTAIDCSPHYGSMASGPTKGFCDGAPMVNKSARNSSWSKYCTAIQVNDGCSHALTAADPMDSTL